MRRLLHAGFMTLLLLAIGGCPEAPNQLRGSIDEQFDLSFDEVRLRKYLQTGEVQVEYLRKPETGSVKDVVAQITVTTPQGGFPLDTEVKFDQVAGKVHRVAAGDDFPPVGTGVITFTAGGNAVGEQTSGDFSVTFDNKRTLSGRFEGELTEATAK